MSEPWRADVEVTVELATHLVDRQFSDLAPARVEPFGSGWDNAVFIVNDAWVFRFPRRAIAAPLIDTEAKYLPLIAAHLPLPVPAPRFVGRPEAGYPYPFLGYALLPGRTACRVALTREQRARMASPLGAFLAALHGVEVTADVRRDAPGDTIRRADLRGRHAAMLERVRQLELTSRITEAIDALVATAPHPSPPCWVHGDLYVRHLLLDDGGSLCGVIDWGDLHLGDPAIDLSIALSFLPLEARAAFAGAYGAIDDAAWARARYRAIHSGLVLLQHGRGIGDADLSRAGREASIWRWRDS